MLLTRMTLAEPAQGVDFRPEATVSSGPSGAIPLSYNQIGAVLAVADFLLITLLGMISCEIYLLAASSPSATGDADFLLGLGSAISFVIVSQLQGHYRPSAILNKRRVFKNIVGSWFVSTGCLLMIAFLGKVTADYSRGAALLFFFATSLVLPVFHVGAQRGLQFLIANGHLNSRRRVLLLGSETQLAGGSVLADLRRHGHGVANEIVILPASAELSEQMRAISASIDHLKHYVSENPIDEIFLAFDSSDGRALDLVTAQLRSVPIPVRMLFDPRLSRLLSTKVTDLGTTKAVRLQSGPLTETQRMFKRAQDILLSFTGLFCFAPLFVIIAIAISLDSKGPVLFRQRRAGFSGRLFRIYKFRSMTSLDDGAVVKQATRDDMRVTRVGRFLRKTSLDELPQLLNVLRGEMSLVGPRPHALSHDNEYNQCIATYALRHHMKPGITGWAQVNGFRGETSTLELMERRVEHDLWYINNWTILLDFKILALTVIQVIAPKDVY